MEQTTSFKGEQFLKKRRNWKRWQKIVSAMACVVVFCTTYALILPAITLEKNVFGSVLVAAAGVLLITKKRMTAR